MKKIVFAVQVFGLIAMFPIVVVLEMTHGTGGSSKRNSTSGVKQKIEIISICLPEKGKDKMGNEAFPVTPETSLLIKAF